MSTVKTTRKKAASKVKARKAPKTKARPKAKTKEPRRNSRSFASYYRKRDSSMIPASGFFFSQSSGIL